MIRKSSTLSPHVASMYAVCPLHGEAQRFACRRWAKSSSSALHREKRPRRAVGGTSRISEESKVWWMREGPLRRVPAAWIPKPAPQADHGLRGLTRITESFALISKAGGANSSLPSLPSVNRFALARKPGTQINRRKRRKRRGPQR